MNNWISVEDKLPDETQEVLVYMPVSEHHWWCHVATIYHSGHFHTQNGSMVSHWMPLPPPPQ